MSAVKGIGGRWGAANGPYPQETTGKQMRKGLTSNRARQLIRLATPQLQVRAHMVIFMIRERESERETC